MGGVVAARLLEQAAALRATLAGLEAALLAGGGAPAPAHPPGPAREGGGGGQGRGGGRGGAAGDDAATLANALALTEKACAVAKARAGARAVQCGNHEREGFPDAAEWFARMSGSTRGQAKGALDTAEAVGADTPIGAALAAG